MTIGTVCSGIGAPEIAFDTQPLWVSEIEKFPSAVLAHHYPDVPNLGDFTTDEAIDHMVSNPPDVFVGGTPCQAFSVAGKRQSLDDDRGNLTLVFTEVWHQLRAAGTKYCVWENVPGVLSTKDNAFGCFLAGMVGAEHPLAVDGRWASAGMVAGQEGVVAWRTLNAQYYGVAQRRRRVFAVIGHPGDFSVAKILFEREGVFGDTAESRETGQDVTTSTGQCPTHSGFNFEMYSGDCKGLAPALQAKRARDSLVYENHPNDSRVKGPLDVCEQLTARNGTGGGNLPLVQEAGNERTDGALLATEYKGPGHNRDDKIAVAYPIDTRNALRDPDKHDAVNRQGVGTGEDGDPSATVTSAHVNAVALAQPQMQVRRLTPTECERLQGFPDNFTRIPWRNKTPENCPDGPRYKAIGNSMAIPCVKFIADRIKELL